MDKTHGTKSPKPPVEEILSRLELGLRKYNHGVRVNDDTRTWGTRLNSWMEMAKEEFLDAIIYVTADYIKVGRNSWRRCALLEKECTQLCRPRTDDNNELIMYIIDNYEHIESKKHRDMLRKLFTMCKLCDD